METVCIIWDMVYDNYKHNVIIRIRENSVMCENGCIEWTGTINNGGYGLIGLLPAGYKSPVTVHRAMYMAVNDCFDLPRNIVIRHKCDNRKCVNIEHIIKVSHKDNAQDKIDRGRNAKKYKLHTRQRKFDDATILAIKSASGKLKWIAEEFGTTTGYVSKIRNGKAKTLVI